MRIGQITPDNYNDIIKMFKNSNKSLLQNNGKIKGTLTEARGTKLMENRELLAKNIDKFSARFQPVDLSFAKPNWNILHTKNKNPSMTDDEFEAKAIEIAISDAKKGIGIADSEAFKKLRHEYVQVASPDRERIYEESMRKTGGKMNAATAFFDHQGCKVLTYIPQSSTYRNNTTDAESKRMINLTSLYIDANNEAWGKEYSKPQGQSMNFTV